MDRDESAKPANPDKTPQAAKPTSKAASSVAPDWERIELDYRAGVKTLRQMADEHGITHGAINKRARRDGWERDLSEKIQQKTEALVSRAAVSRSVSTESKAAEREVVEANANARADVLLGHRKDIQRGKAIVMRLLDELEQQTGLENVALLEQLGELLRSEDDKGQDRLNDLYHKVISLPERSKTAKILTESLRISIDMQRQAFGLDAKNATPEGSGGARIAVEFVKAIPRAEDDDE